MTRWHACFLPSPSGGGAFPPFGWCCLPVFLVDCAAFDAFPVGWSSLPPLRWSVLPFPFLFFVWWCFFPLWIVLLTSLALSGGAGVPCLLLGGVAFSFGYAVFPF